MKVSFDRKGRGKWEPAYYDVPTSDGGGKEFNMDDGMRFEPNTFELMSKEIEEINTEFLHNTLFIASDGRYIYKCVYVPAQALSGQDEPVLFKGAEEQMYIAAYSKETIEEIIRKTESHEDSLQNDYWNITMEEMVNCIADKVRDQPPADWVTIL